LVSANLIEEYLEQLTGIGTDATIAEHIAKIIERQYVSEKQQERIKYLLPSLLGVGLVEGFNQIGLDRSLSKPQLRREVGRGQWGTTCTDAQTEHRMQLICDGVNHKREVLETTLDEYKDVFVRVSRDFSAVVNVCLLLPETQRRLTI
jgi:DNA topoisomerase-3